MEFKRFVNATKRWWENYFLEISLARDRGRFHLLYGEKLLFPNILLCSNCNGIYVAEFVGAVEKFNGLVQKIHKEESIYRYLSQFDDKVSSGPIFDFANARMSRMKNLCLASGDDVAAAKDRFPQLELVQTKLVREKNIEGGSPLRFGPGFHSITLQSCFLLNRKDHLLRCKSISSMHIVSSSITENELSQLFANGKGGVIKASGVKHHRLAMASQLQNLYLFPNLRETTIGEFIRLHPEVVKEAFKADKFLYEPTFKWIEHDGTSTDKTINPDLLIQRKDGKYDIYDLKTAMLDRDSVTKADRKRRRFVDYVAEGIAQLANYREYFEYPANRKYAKETYDVEVSNPNLVLIVGSWENVNIVEVNQACRQYRGVEVIDYDTFCQLFRGATDDAGLTRA